MKKSGAKTRSEGGDPVASFSQAQPVAFRAICEVLRKLITTALPGATSKVWHGSPVWFIDENPVVGYSVTAKGVQLLFWNGRAFDEPVLQPMGKYRAAQAVYSDAADVESKVIGRWLTKAKADVFDSKGFFKKMRASK